VKKGMKLYLLGLSVGLTLSFSGCLGTANTTNEQTKGGVITEEELGLRKSNLYTEEQPLTSGVEYIKDAPGTSKLIERAFENAPPMIPHDVEGMLPITKEMNACTGCHMPEVAPSMNATAIPKSHFTNFRPQHKMVKGEFVTTTDVMKNDVVEKDLGELYQGRFNCSQCHAPQATRAPAVASEFQADFRSENGKSKSNLLDVVNEGVR